MRRVRTSDCQAGMREGRVGPASFAALSAGRGSLDCRLGADPLMRPATDQTVDSIARRALRGRCCAGPTRSSNWPSTASRPTRPRHDLTAGATFESSDPAVATVDASGMITARGDGRRRSRSASGSLEATVPVEVKEFTAGLPVNFANQVVPIFTKLGCNAGGCHGKASGQNGFRLSLLGFEPALDYETLVKEGRGRRLFPAAPEPACCLPRRRPRCPTAAASGSIPIRTSIG